MKRAKLLSLPTVPAATHVKPSSKWPPRLRALAGFFVCVLVSGLGSLAPTPSWAATACGGDGQRACCVTERPGGILGPPCNSGLYEVPGCAGDCKCGGFNPLGVGSIGTCAAPPPPPTACGGDGQRACCVVERPGSPCNPPLIEIGGCSGNCTCAGVNPGGLIKSSGHCAALTPCGGAGQRACCVGERFPSCNSGMHEVGGCAGECTCGGPNVGGLVKSFGHCEVNAPPPPPPTACGGAGQRACCVVERPGKPCDPPLIEIGGCTGNCTCGGVNPFGIKSSGHCAALTPCGGAGQRACCVGERFPSCNPGMHEVGGCAGECTCGGPNVGGLVKSFGHCEVNPPPPPPKANTVEIDICEEVITEILIPPIPQVTWTCNNGWHCIALPHCCIPGLCGLDPLCKATEKVVGWTEAALQGGVTLECRVENIDPKAELLNWLRGSVASLDDVLLPFVKEAVRTELNVAKLSASKIPAAVRDALNELTLPHRNSGQNKFRSVDIFNAWIISGANPLVSEYLREEKGFAAITLGDLIIIEDGTFRVLMDSRNYVTAAQLHGGTANCEFRNAVALLAHELVHIRQYADLGFDTFLINYLIEALAFGYGSDSFETEAYGYSNIRTAPLSGLFGALIQTCGVSTTASKPLGLSGAPQSRLSGLDAPQSKLSVSGAGSAALTGAAATAQKNLLACLGQRGAVPKACFDQVKGYYPVTAAEQAKLLTPAGKAPPKLRRDYYVKAANGRLLKVITNEKLGRDDVLNRMCIKPVFKPGPLVPPNIRTPKTPVRPLGLNPVLNLPPAPLKATQPTPTPFRPMTIQPTPTPVRPMTIQPNPNPVKPAW